MQQGIANAIGISVVIATEAQGAGAAPAVVNTRITEASDTRITEASDIRITE